MKEQKFVQQTFPTMMPTKGKGNKHHTVEISKGPLNPLEDAGQNSSMVESSNDGKWLGPNTLA